MTARTQSPAPGLYDPRFEHDACGVGFIASIKGQKTHNIVVDGLKILENLTHRGAVGADPNAGDGAGILLQISDRFFREAVEFELPAAARRSTCNRRAPRSNASRDGM